ncbi:hypothetical protein bpr_IV137 (plasmid) [Butyrivibrio proteoclasticus B316]|uniref:Uncharacterized protein n=1 Tax=Butyrivibrio proteoclasticus (strain ATCC 51982 / DSM 14932 / B316) TaxID=515622 RepID=E0S519_BUTPB|nr:hypothetical protein [Butyrivibrio proteoclasticus]ADL36501.1 hypothetical protein bpr_IV137 [Butyrivibrio proteoclasticus B316]
MADSVEYVFRDALRKYSCDEGKKNVYGVCWYAYLLDKFGCENEAILEGCAYRGKESMLSMIYSFLEKYGIEHF